MFPLPSAVPHRSAAVFAFSAAVLWPPLLSDLCAQTPLLPNSPLTSYAYYDAVPGGSATQLAVTGQPFNQAVRISTSGTGANVYDAQLGWNTAAPVTQGDLLLLTFWARRLAPLDGKTIEAQVVMERNGGDYLHSLTCSFPNDTDQWQRYRIPFRAAASHLPGEARVAFQFSIGPQTFEIGGLSLANYGQAVSPGVLPTAFYYPGREANAPWRAQAAARIEQFRKGPVTIRVVDCLGQAIPNASVRLTLKRHAFGFGTAVAANVLVGTGTDADTYRSTFSANFSSAVIENHLKWPFWEAWARSDALAALAWLNMRNIPVRGHNLIWPNFGNMPGDTAALSPAALRSRIDAHFAEILGATRGKLTEWDVVNEPYSSFDIMGRIGGVAGVAPSPGVLGNAELVRWFQLARAADPAIGMVLNDYNVLEGVDPNHRAYTAALVAWMLANGAPITRLGLQSHFGNAIIPIPELQRRIDTLSALPVRFSVTEFDVDTLDETLQADYTRDFLTLIFSTPRFDEFLMWGFWENAHWLPSAAMFRADWSPKPNALAWRDLVYSRWHTEVIGQTDSDGRFTAPGFFGQYELQLVAPDAAAGTAPFITSVNHASAGATNSITLPAALSAQPLPATACRGGDVSFRVPTPVSPLTASHQWQGRVGPSGTWVNLSSGITVGLGTISGATSGTLTLRSLPGNPALTEFRCIVTPSSGAPCVPITSRAASLAITRPCSIADLAGQSSTSGFCGDGVIDGNDFVAFINSYALGDPAIDAHADVAGSGVDGLSPDGVIDGSDFVAFINAFSLGC